MLNKYLRQNMLITISLCKFITLNYQLRKKIYRHQKHTIDLIGSYLPYTKCSTCI